MSGSKFKQIKRQQSVIRDKLMQEAVTLENDPGFMERCKTHPIEEILFLLLHSNGHMHGVYPDRLGETVPVNMLKRALEERFGQDITRPEIKATIGNVIPSDYPQEEVVPDLPKLPRRIVFHNRQAIGDILMFTCAVRDFKAAFPEVEVRVNSTAMHIWDYNKNICQDSWIEVLDPYTLYKGKEKLSDQQRLDLTQRAIKIATERDLAVQVYIGPGKATNASNRSDRHFSNAYRISMETVLGVRIPQGPIRPDVYMSEEEYSAPPIIEPPYWLITAGEKGDWTCKTFPFMKWQEVVEKSPQIKFVQLGSAGHKHPDLSGSNVINMIGKTEDRHRGIRDLWNLFNYCEGSMGLVSFQMHLAAAFNKPCVVIAGAREPVHFTRYPGQQYLASDGCLPCTVTKGNDAPTACWFCKIERCPDHSNHEGQEVPLCADLFTSDEVVNAIERYYFGGRLLLDKPIGKSKLVNVVKSDIVLPLVVKGESVLPKKIVDGMKPTIGDVIQGLPKIKEKDYIQQVTLEVDPITDANPTPENLWGYTFGGGALTDRDWEFMQRVIKENKVNTVLEFGAGLSTLLLGSLGLDVTTFEDRVGWIDDVLNREPRCDIRQWNGTVDSAVMPILNKKFDLVFVDGPAGGQNREWSTKIASLVSDLVIVHDAGREWEKKWQEQYLEPDFYLASKGGHRCHMWRRGELEPVVFDPSPEKKLMKFVFNGRGEGGAERTCHGLMQQFIDRGWEVQYISPNPVPSGTFRHNPINEVFFTNDLNEIKEPCDLLFLYANDWIWEFPKLGDAFSNLQAKRKVMGINYKMGGIGRAPWTFGWDNYIFLNSMMKDEFIKRCDGRPVGPTRVLAPPTILDVYYNNQPDYGGNLRLIRHSSQGDVKYPKAVVGKDDELIQMGFNQMLTRIMEEVPGSEVFLMPAPTFLDDIHKANDRIHTFQKNKPPVPEFLSYGNCFWYALPGGGYTEGGPKVIMEAQASGLPIIADNHSGPVDRLAYGGGYLCDNFEEQLSAMKHVNDPARRELLGTVSRQRAMEYYNPDLWIQEIIGGKENDLRCDDRAETEICRQAEAGV